MRIDRMIRKKKAVKLPRMLVLAGMLVAAPALVLVPGCGGGGTGIAIPNPVAPNPALVGTYQGQFRYTSGANNGNSGALTFVLASDGRITGNINLGSSGIAPLRGVTTSQNGNFRVVENSSDSRFTFEGQFETVNGVITGRGTFAGDGAGTFSLTKTTVTTNAFTPGTYRFNFSVIEPGFTHSGNFTFQVNSSGQITPANFDLFNEGSNRYVFAGTISSSGALSATATETTPNDGPNDPLLDATFSTTLQNQSGQISGSGDIVNPNPDPGTSADSGNFTVTKIS